MILDRFENEALGIAVAPEDLATVEACAGLYERAIASAAVEPMGAAIQAMSPHVLALVGRGLALFGQAVLLIDVDPMRGLTLTPASSWDVSGSPLEAEWRYRLDLLGPSGSFTVTRPGAAVLHFQDRCRLEGSMEGKVPAAEMPGNRQPLRVDRSPTHK